MKPLTINLTTLTPLWTGGVDTTTDRLHETGIIGSLRWWYEVIVRGLGGKACDPIANKCNFNNKEYEKAKQEGKSEREALSAAELCDVCQVFGATGWRRRFRVKLGVGEPLFQRDAVLVPSGRIDRSGNRPRAGGWYIGPGRVGNAIALDLLSTFGFFDFDTLVVPTFKLIENWTALGAKAQNGYGVVGIRRLQKGQYSPLEVSEVQNGLPSGKRLPDMFPALVDFFFCKVRFRPKNDNWWQNFTEIKSAFKGKVSDDEGTEKLRNPITENVIEKWLKESCFPLAPILKNWFRYDVFSFLSKGKANFVFGTVDTVCPRCYLKVHKKWDKCRNCKCDLTKHKPIERLKSKIGLSFAYKAGECWEFRMWGWLPQQKVLDAPPRNLKLNRENDILKVLYESFKPIGALWNSGPLKGIAEPCETWQWREFESERDTYRTYTNSHEFLRSLVIKEGKS